MLAFRPTAFSVMLVLLFGMPGMAGAQITPLPVVWTQSDAGLNDIPVKRIAFGTTDGSRVFMIEFNKPLNEASSEVVLYIDSDNNPDTGRPESGGNEYRFVFSKNRLVNYYQKGEKTEADVHDLEKMRVSGNTFVVKFPTQVTEQYPFENRFRLLIRSSQGKLPYQEISTSANLGTMQMQKPEAPSNKAVLISPHVRVQGQSVDDNRKRYALIGSRNEYVSAQLMVSLVNPDDAGAIRIDWTELKGESGSIPRDEIELHRIVNVPLWVPEDESKRYVYEGTGDEPHLYEEVPDRLHRYERGAADSGWRNRLQKLEKYWVTIHAPGKTPAGKYEGEFRVKIGDGKTVSRPFTLEVTSFTIPERPSFTFFGALPRFASYKSDRFDINPSTDDQGRTIHRTVLDYEWAMRDLAKHRLTVRSPRIKPSLKFSSDGEPVIDYSRFDPLVRFMLDELKMNPRLNIPFGTVSRGHGHWYTDRFGPVGPGRVSEEFKRKYVKTLRAVHEHLKANGWGKYFFAYFADEPSEDQYEEVRQVVSLIRKADEDLVPWCYGLPPSQTFFDILHTWMTGTSTLSEDYQSDHSSAELVQRALERGDRYGIYNPKDTYILTRPPSYVRSLVWWAYERDLFWMSMWTFGPHKPWWVTHKLYRSWWNWVYPPENTTATRWDPSVRWQMTRGGMQDYEYFKALTDESKRILSEVSPSQTGDISARSLAMDYIRPAVFNYMKRSSDPALVTNLREYVIRELQALRKNPNFFATHELKDDQIVLQCVASPGTQVKIGNRRFTISDSGYERIVVGRNSLTQDYVLTMDVSNGSQSKQVKKMIVPPLAEDESQ